MFAGSMHTAIADWFRRCCRHQGQQFADSGTEAVPYLRFWQGLRPDQGLQPTQCGYDAVPCHNRRMAGERLWRIYSCSNLLRHNGPLLLHRAQLLPSRQTLQEEQTPEDRRILERMQPRQVQEIIPGQERLIRKNRVLVWWQLFDAKRRKWAPRRLEKHHRNSIWTRDSKEKYYSFWTELQ